MTWLEQSGQESDVVISSRIRLARNLKKYPFKQKILPEQAIALKQEVVDALINDKTILAKEFEYINFEVLSSPEKLALVEKNVVSAELMNEKRSGLLLSKDEKVSIMINEEDHIRLQIIYPGFDLMKAWEYGNKIDDVLEESLEYAFDERFGYLTSCPTNMGTGLRASVMMHLPGIEMSHNMSRVVQSITKFGLTVRGIHGEGTEAYGSLYQISNQITLGLSEEEIIKNLQVILQRIIENEREIRKTLYKENPILIEDQVFRSYGILKYAKKVSHKEAFKLLSDVKLGIDLGIIDYINREDLIGLWMKIQPASLQRQNGGPLAPVSRDVIRAELIQKTI